MLPFVVLLGLYHRGMTVGLAPRAEYTRYTGGIGGASVGALALCLHV